eukprot:jgi/Psemu1/316770/fgenesh1_kg.4049_\
MDDIGHNGGEGSKYWSKMRSIDLHEYKGKSTAGLQRGMSQSGFDMLEHWFA